MSPSFFVYSINIFMPTYPTIVPGRTSDAPFTSDKPNISSIDDIPSALLESMSEFAFGVQLDSFFTVTFDPGLPEILTDENNLLNIDQKIKGFSSKGLVDLVQSDNLFSKFGVLFVRTINVPGYKTGIAKAGGNYRDFKPVPVMSPFGGDNVIVTSIAETHVSFTDFIIRPWVILNTHYGLVERNPNDPEGSLINSLRLNYLTITQFARTGSDLNRTNNDTVINYSDLQIVKQFRFSKCTPVDVDDLQLGHGGGSKLIERKISWVFQDYEIDIPG